MLLEFTVLVQIAVKKKLTFTNYFTQQPLTDQKSHKNTFIKHLQFIVKESTSYFLFKS